MPVLKRHIITPIVGLDVSRPGELIDARSTPNCQNMDIDRSVLAQRYGGTALGSSLGERILGIAELEIGINTYLVRVGPTEAEVLDKNTSTWSSIASSALTATAEDLVSFAFPLIGGAKYMVYTNGVDAIRKYSGTGNDAALGGSPPLARYALAFGGYLVLAYVIDSGTTYYTRVQWSDTGDPEEWSTGNAGSVTLAEDDIDITGMAVYGDFIAVHKENSIYLGQPVTTADVFRFTRQETGVGTIANGSIQNLPNGNQIFLGRDGLHLFNGVIAPLIESPIMDELRSTINPQWVKRATSVIVAEEDEYWLGVPTGNQEEPETVYKYNYRTGQVYKDYREDLMVMALFKKTENETWDEDGDSWDSDITRWDSVNELAQHRRVITGDVSGNTVERTSSANDNGTAIDAFWDSKDFNITDLDSSKPIGSLVRWTQLEVWAKGNGVTVYYSTDEGTTWVSRGTLTLDSDYPTDSNPDMVYLDVISSKIRFRFRNSTAGESFTLKQFWIKAIPREVRN